MTALADSTRSRILLLLERHELTVNEIRSILQLPQSTVSRHLKTLGDHDWIVSRPEGTSRRYRAAEKLERRRKAVARRARTSHRTPAAAHDARRVQTVLAHRAANRRNSFRHPRASGIASGRALRYARRHTRTSWTAGRIVDGWRSGLRHGSAHRIAGAVRRSSHCRRRFVRDARRGAPPRSRR